MSLAHDVSGLISTRYVRFLRSGQGARCMSGDRHELLPDGRPGADDEDPRSDFASFGEEDYVVASSRDHRDHRPTDAAVALALQGVWLRRLAGSVPGEAQPQAGAADSGRAGDQPI